VRLKAFILPRQARVDDRQLRRSRAYRHQPDNDAGIAGGIVLRRPLHRQPWCESLL